MSEAILVRKCNKLEEFQACVELQREVWGEADLEVEPTTMFVVAAHTGGQVLGAFDGEKLIGYTLAVAGARDGRSYLHSHHTGVAANYRDRGVGRMLKVFQREEALSRGITLVEWTFDPLELRNAHFNLNRLGAISREYVPNLYGVTTSPLHRGLATDRLVAEWHLASPRVTAAIGNAAGENEAGAAFIELPSQLEEWKQRHDCTKLKAVQARICKEFTELFARGYAATGVQKKDSGTAYVLAPRRES